MSAKQLFSPDDHALCQLLSATFCAMLDYTSDVMFLKDVNSVYIAASEPFMRMFGKTSLDQIIGHTDYEVIDSKELADRYFRDDRALLAGDRDLINYVEPLSDDLGRPRYSSTSKFIIRDSEGKPIGILGVCHDITKEFMARQRHQQELRYLFELPRDTYAVLFMDIDDWRIIRHQRRTEGEHILDGRSTMQEFADNALSRLVDPSDRKTAEFYHALSPELMRTLCDGGQRSHSLEYLRRMPNGEEIWVRVDIHFIIDPENGHLCAIWTLNDINARKQEEIDLLHAAEHDELTGILNRAATTKYIQQTLSDHENAQHALFIIDVNKFKSLNDTLGHPAGDGFLCTLAKTLKSCFRDSDIVGRIGGDEFFLLMKNVPGTRIIADKAAAIFRAAESVCSQYNVKDLSVSIGIAAYPADGQSLEDLYSAADTALYHAKKSNGERIAFAPGCRPLSV